jgi:sodium-dependent dicarboxylate transporter 2/3/5
MATDVGRRFCTEQLRELGLPSRAERLMIGVFLATAMLWLFRTDLKFADVTLVPGWGGWLEDVLDLHALTGVPEDKDVIHDSTVAMAMAVLMFLLPAGRDDRDRPATLMDWHTAERLPWGILLLFGGGLALAGAFQSTGLAQWLGNEFAGGVADWPTWLVVAGIAFLLTFLSELTSNVATAATLLPVVAGTATTVGVDPLLMMVPATLGASCGFMLPVATPPNAIAYATGRITTRQMAAYGLALNLIGVVLITLATFLFVAPVFGVSVRGQ